GIACDCLPGYKLLSKNDHSVHCQKCPDNLGVTTDGWNCIKCPGGLTLSRKCQCSIGKILVERASNGTLLHEAGCVDCDGFEPSFTWPDASGFCCCEAHQGLINFLGRRHTQRMKIRSVYYGRNTLKSPENSGP
ncbi:unnamed protein product, partial [Ranitomeya imitator]